jgi:hypothetical protein
MFSLASQALFLSPTPDLPDWRTLVTARVLTAFDAHGEPTVLVPVALRTNVPKGRARNRLNRRARGGNR